jgi:hypothetical protein
MSVQLGSTVLVMQRAPTPLPTLDASSALLARAHLLLAALLVTVS